MFRCLIEAYSKSLKGESSIYNCSDEIGLERDITEAFMKGFQFVQFYVPLGCFINDEEAMNGSVVETMKLLAAHESNSIKLDLDKEIRDWFNKLLQWKLPPVDIFQVIFADIENGLSQKYGIDKKAFFKELCHFGERRATVRWLWHEKKYLS